MEYSQANTTIPVISSIFYKQQRKEMLNVLTLIFGYIGRSFGDGLNIDVTK